MKYNKNIMFYILYINVLFSWRTLIQPSIWYNWYSLLVKKNEKFYLVVFPLLSFPCSSAGKESTCNAGDLGSIPGLEDPLEKGKGHPLQYSGLENSMDCIVHGATESDTSEQPSLTSLSPFRLNAIFLMEINFSKSNAMRLYLNTRNMSMSGLEKWIRNRDM